MDRLGLVDDTTEAAEIGLKIPVVAPLYGDSWEARFEIGVIFLPIVRLRPRTSSSRLDDALSAEARLIVGLVGLPVTVECGIVAGTRGKRVADSKGMKSGILV